MDSGVQNQITITARAPLSGGLLRRVSSCTGYRSGPEWHAVSHGVDGRVRNNCNYSMDWKMDRTLPSGAGLRKRAHRSAIAGPSAAERAPAPGATPGGMRGRCPGAAQPGDDSRCLGEQAESTSDVAATRTCGCLAVWPIMGMHACCDNLLGHGVTPVAGWLAQAMSRVRGPSTVGTAHASQKAMADLMCRMARTSLSCQPAMGLSPGTKARTRAGAWTVTQVSHPSLRHPVVYALCVRTSIAEDADARVITGCTRPIWQDHLSLACASHSAACPYMIAGDGHVAGFKKDCACATTPTEDMQI
ncbi:hypothetical protein JB92DRAFT_2830322 [Gautieria morchelliformis]|nr:hypothetical protein JB92DRAFT_2830322 [Gautieria morchelliformis]